MSETSYLKLMKGSRLANYMRLEMDKGQEVMLGKNYMYIDIPLVGAVLEDGTTTMSLKRNQHVWISAAAHVDIKGRNFIEIEPNRLLGEFGEVQGLYRLHPDCGRTRLGFWFSAKRDVDLTPFKYAVRLYMPA